MNIVVIGHLGYLGRSLFAYLKQHHNVFGWDIQQDMFNLNAKFLADNNIEAVINLSVVADRKSPNFILGEPTDVVNVEGCRHLARILKGSDIAWYQLSTREVLGPVYKKEDVIETPDGYRPRFLVSEDFPYAPSNFYGKSKIMAEFISESHPKSAVIRLTTCYTDYGHPAGNWVVSLVRAAVQGKLVSLTQGGLQFRDPLHSDDLGALIEKIHSNSAFGEKYHAGGGEENMISLLEFIQRADPSVVVNSAPGGDFGFAFDNAKAIKLTGWKPKVLVRDRLPIIADNLRRGIESPP